MDGAVKQSVKGGVIARPYVAPLSLEQKRIRSQVIDLDPDPRAQAKSELMQSDVHSEPPKYVFSGGASPVLCTYIIPHLQDKVNIQVAQTFGGDFVQDAGHPKSAPFRERTVRREKEGITAPFPLQVSVTDDEDACLGDVGFPDAQLTVPDTGMMGAVIAKVGKRMSLGISRKGKFALTVEKVKHENEVGSHISSPPTRVCRRGAWPQTWRRAQCGTRRHCAREQTPRHGHKSHSGG